MGLFRMEGKTLTAVPQTTFAAQQVWERTHLQAALRDNISLLDIDLKVVAEEFGDFAEANRRIDLLCVDRQARLTVVELKRTGDGGHMELQALRYAAMVSAMTFDELVEIYGRHMSKTGGGAKSAAREELLDWLDDSDSEEPVIERAVRIVLVASGFDKQITTTALWLNEIYAMDIRCVKLTPYMVDDAMVLDVQTVIPLPEAEDYLVHLKRREMAARAARTAGGAVRYIIVNGHVESAALPKRRAVLEMVTALIEIGVDPEELRGILRPAQWLRFDGELSVEELADAFAMRYPDGNLSRYWSDEPIVHTGATWLLTNQWGRRTAGALEAMSELGAEHAISYRLA